MKIVRTILAVLITLSLTFAPGASAFASTHERGAPAMTVSAHTKMMGEMKMDDTAMADMGMASDMSDCMKAMQGAPSDNSKSGCKCCGTKSSCLDHATCMAKCCKVIGALKPAGNVMTLTAMVYRQIEPAKPPEWARTPPAPPPRT